MKYLMGIDCGGTVVKTSIFDLQGREQSSYGITIPVTSLGAGRYERDVSLIERSAYLSISGAIEKAGVAPDEIVGIGPKRRAALLKHFRSVKAIREADEEALRAVLPALQASAVYAFFHGEEEQPCE